ncbi:MAG: helix-turn-helix transcriptional regulator [bacterium]|nr:helix-turn-helix transcriptional regulator [bacterium]
MREWNEVKKEILKDPEVFREYNKLGPRYALISQLIAARLKRKVTQKQLAFKIKTKQSAIARLESGNANPTFDFLDKIARALNLNLSINFTPRLTS